MIDCILCKLKKNKKVYLNFFVYILFLSSLILYFLSLKGCFLSFNACSSYRKIGEYFYLGFLLISSCLAFSLLILVQIISGLKRLNYIVFIITYLIIFLFNQGTDFAYHGTYNSIIFVLFFPIFLFLFYF